MRKNRLDIIFSFRKKCLLVASASRTSTEVIIFKDI